MKMTATIELEFESVGETNHNAMDQALIRGLEALKKGIELRETGTPRRSIKPDSTKWNIVQRVSSQTMRRFPAPWTVEKIPGGFKIADGNKQTIAYVYGHANPGDAAIAKSLTLDEARRIASNIAKLPSLVSKRARDCGFCFFSCHALFSGD
jgi:hypothetical protein